MTFSLFSEAIAKWECKMITKIEIKKVLIFIWLVLVAVKVVSLTMRLMSNVVGLIPVSSYAGYSFFIATPVAQRSPPGSIP